MPHVGNFAPRHSLASRTKLAIVNCDPTPLDSLADFNHHSGIGEFFKQLNRCWRMADCIRS